MEEQKSLRLAFFLTCSSHRNLNKVIRPKLRASALSEKQHRDKPIDRDEPTDRWTDRQSKKELIEVYE